jgi:cytoskeletal protein RodZ
MVKNLWKLDRGARDDAGAGGTAPSATADSNYQTVGATLRARREERNEDLRFVAQMLRIRYPYLKAIEDGRPDELPGPTYAIGFVRTYADHLGLDSDRMVQRFKAEAEGLHARADLHFPAPLREGKIPSAGVLVVAVILAASIYGAWIYMSSRDQQVAEIVPQLPNRISEIIKGKSSAPGDAASSINVNPVPSAAPEAGSAPAAAPAQEAPSPVLESRSAAAIEAPAPAVPAVPEPQKAPEAAGPSAAPGQPAPAPSESAAAATESDSEVPPAPSDVTEDQTAARTDAPVEGVPQPTGDAGRLPSKVYGSENSSARIVIHAAADSWVEVRDSRTDELLLTRVLFKGDSYRVPDRAGLTLLTGNAGGLRIAVDGQDTPSLGPFGAVRRNVLLEPGPLKSGTAIGDGASSRPEAQPSFGFPTQ